MHKVLGIVLACCTLGCATFKKDVKTASADVAEELKVCKPEMQAELVQVFPFAATYIACVVGNGGDTSKCSGEIEALKASGKDEVRQCAIAMVKDAQQKIGAL